MLKLILKSTGEAFQLDKDFELSFQLNNPLFEDSGSLTFSGTINAESDVNRRLCNYPNQAGVKVPQSEFNVYLSVSGVQIPCLMIIVSGTDTEIKFTLQFDEGEFISQYGEFNLNELDFEGDQTIPDSVFDSLPDWDHAMYAKIWPEVKVAFPLIYNPNYFDDTEFETSYKEDSNFQNIPAVRQVTAGGLLFERKIFPITPCPYLGYVVNRVFESFGYQVTENHLKKGSLKKLILLNTVDIAETSIELINGIGTFSAYTRSTYNVVNHVPEISIKKFLQSLRNKFNIIPFINNNKVRLISFDEILKNPAAEDLTQYALTPELYKKNEYTGFEFKVSGAKTLSYTSEQKELEDIQDKLVSPKLTEEEKNNGTYKLNEIREIISSYNYYAQLIYFEETGEYIWSNLGLANYGDYSIASTLNPLEFESLFSYTFKKTYSGKFIVDNATSYVQTATSNMTGAGISELIPDSNSTEGLVLAFYLGKPEGEIYPMSHYTDIYDSTSPLNYETILKYEGEKGLVNKFFKNTLNFWENAGDIYKVQWNDLPAYKLFNWDFATKHIIHGSSFIVKNIKGKFTMEKGIVYDPSELMKC